MRENRKNIKCYPYARARAARIREDGLTGQYSIPDLVAKYGLSSSHISNILRCKRCVTEVDRAILVSQIRKDRKAAKVHLLRKLALKMKTIAEYVEISQTHATRLLHHHTPTSMAEVSVCLLQPVEESIHATMVKTGDYTVRYIGSDDECVLEKPGTVALVKRKDLIGKVKVRTNGRVIE